MPMLQAFCQMLHFEQQLRSDRSDQAWSVDEGNGEVRVPLLMHYTTVNSDRALPAYSAVETDQHLQATHRDGCRLRHIA